MGIHAVVFDAGGFDTALGSPRDGEELNTAVAMPVADYQDHLGELLHKFGTEIAPNRPGDVDKLSRAVIDVIKGEGLAKGRKWPVRVVLGPDAKAIIRQKCREQLELCEEWEDVADSVTKDDWSGVISKYVLDTCSMRK